MSEQKEQQAEKKKASLAKRILKWFGFGLFALLLIVSIIFQGPWKVTTLFGIFAASFFFPKPYGKYFWLCVGGITIALVIWVFLPEETEGWRPYTFDEELTAFKAKYAIPDEENAAVIYNQLLKDYNEAAFRPNFDDPNLKYLIRKEYWLSEDHPEAAQWLKQQKGTIAKLIEASKIEQCRFPIKADVINFDTLDRTSAMRRRVELLISAANNDIAEGRTEEGLEKYIAVLQMGKHQRQQLAMIDLLSGIAIEMLSNSNLKRFIVEGDATEENLDLIEKELTEIKHDWSADLPRIIDYEKLLAKNFCGMFYAVNAEGKIRLKPGVATRVMRRQLPEDMKEKFVITYWRERLMKASTIWVWFYMPSTPQKAGEIIDSAYKRFYAMADPDFNWQQKPPELISHLGRWIFTRVEFNFNYFNKFIADMLEGSYYSIHDIYLRAISQQRGVLLTIVLRRYKNKTGNWPENLDEVKSFAAEEVFVDPMNGGTFVYKLTDGNFELYSKGKNSIDEDGQYNSTWDPNSHELKIKEDDLLIWSPIGTRRKTEGEGVK
jgi:hypothetical protein